MNRTTVTAVLSLSLLLASCTLEPRHIPYQARAEAQAGQTGAVGVLQRSAVEALQQQSYLEAVEYLQRAIRIEPRNPRSWHYLGQTYWHRKDYDRCLEMVERSFSYSSGADDLDVANRQLRARCQTG